MLRDLWQKLSFTVILVTHDLREAAFLADKIHVMSARPDRIVMTTVVSETVGANAGLGYQIALAGSNFQMPLVFAALLLLAVEGIAMYAVFAYIEVHFTRWAFRSLMSAAA